jgi:hypothetical protein
MQTHSLHLFNGQFLFIVKFLLEVLSVFVLGGLIGQLLHLDSAFKKNEPHSSGNMNSKGNQK